jgi:hypothetical protein
VGITFGSIYLYIWLLKSHTPDLFHGAFFWLLCVGFPLFCIALSQRSFPEFSLDFNQNLRALRMLTWFTLIATLAMFTVAWRMNSFHYDGALPSRLAEYVFWAFLQQIGLQIFLTRRLARIFKKPWVVALWASGLFSLVHAPNPALMIFSGLGAFFWAYAFQIAPSLYVLSLSHAWLAVWMLYTIPPAWLRALRIGPAYFTWSGF